MAGPNESNKKGMNTFADDIDRSSTLSELERIGQRASRKGFQRTQLEDRIKNEGKLLNSLMEQGRTTPEFRDSPFYQEQTGALRESIKGIRTKMNSMDTTARTRAESEASNYIGRQFASTAINAQTSVMQKESATQNRAFSMSGQTYDQLSAQREDVLADIRVRERQAQNEVKGMFSGRGEVNPEKSAALGVMMGGTEEHIRKLATINAAQTLQKATGQDPNSKIRNLAELGGVANSILSAESIGKEVQSGGINISSGRISNQDVNKEIINQARILSEALKQLSEGVGKTDEELAKFRETADNAASDFGKLQQAQNSGAGGSRWGNTISTLNNMAQGFGIVGQTAQSLMVDQRMGQLSNTIGFANLANERYNTYRQARAGSVASQYSLLDEGSAEVFATEMHNASNVVRAAYGTGSALQGAAGGMQAATTANPLENVVSTSAAQRNRQEGLLQLGAGAAGATVNLLDYKREVTSNQNAIAAQSLGLDAKKALRYVSSEQAQGLRDYSVGLGVVGMEMGGNASNFIEEAGSDTMLDNLINSRLSPEQFIEMSRAGAAGMGSAFKANNVVSARNLERAGLGSVHKNIQRMSTLTAAGSNNPQDDLANVLEGAVANGLKSSAALDAIVQNTAATVSAVAQASGIDAASAGSALISGTVNKDLAAKNDIFAAQRASTVQQTLSNLANDTSVSYSGMLNTANISNKTGLSTIDSAFAGDIDIATLKGMRNSKDADRQLLNMGVDWEKSKMTSPQELIDQLIENKLSAAMVGSGALELDTTGGKMSASLAQKIKSGESLSRDEQQLAAKLGMSNQKGVGGSEFASGLGAWFSEPNKSDTISKAMKGDIPVSAQTIADDLRTSGFKQAGEAAKQAAIELGGFTKAIQTFVALQSTFEKRGQENEGEYSGMSKKMAQDFSVSTKMFSEGSKQFKAAVEKFEKLPGIQSSGTAFVPPELIDLQRRMGVKQ